MGVIQGDLGFRAEGSFELLTKLLQEGYIGDYIGDYYRAYSGRYSEP